MYELHRKITILKCYKMTTKGSLSDHSIYLHHHELIHGVENNKIILGSMYFVSSRSKLSICTHFDNYTECGIQQTCDIIRKKVII